jgi:hypothetical protein
MVRDFYTQSENAPLAHFKSTTMFYEGDLQSGISKAMQESRLVACFLTGNAGRAALASAANHQL